MEPTSTSAPVTPISIGLRYGLLLGLSRIILDFLIRIAGLSFISFGIVTSSVAIVASIIGLVLAHSAFKRSNNGLMNYSQGVTISIVVLLIAGTFSSLFNYVYVTYIDADFVERLKNGMVEFMEQHQVPDSEIAKGTARFDEMKAGFGKSLLNGLSYGLGSGLIIGLIVSAFTKRQPKDFE